MKTSVQDHESRPVFNSFGNGHLHRTDSNLVPGSRIILPKSQFQDWLYQRCWTGYTARAFVP